MDLRLAGRKALVTGGTRGIGAAVVDILADEGVSVGFCARTSDDIASRMAELERRGAKVFGATVDVADGDALSQWVADATDKLGGCDIIVANVSAMPPENREQDWIDSFNVDMLHTVRLVDAALPFLENSDCGSIIAISSVSGREVDAAWGAYATMKAAIVVYIQGLAYNLAAKGIRANSVAPGTTYFEGGFWAQAERESPEMYAEALQSNPIGRMARPEEIAYAVAMLASPRASFISGTNLVVDGAASRGIQL